MEVSRLIVEDPGETDYSWHSICLYLLLAMGEALKFWSRDFTPEHLALFDITHRDLEAGVEALKQTARERNHGFTDAEVEATKRLIFGGAP